MKEKVAGKTQNKHIVTKFSFTLGQQGTLHYVVFPVIMTCIIILIWAFVLYHIIGNREFTIK